MIKKSSEQRVGGMLQVMMLLFVFGGIALITMGFQTYFHGTGPSTYTPSKRTKLTPAPQIQLTRASAEQSVKELPPHFTLADGAEMAGIPQVTDAKNPTTSEPGAAEQSQDGRVSIGMGGMGREGAKPTQTIIK